MAAVDDHEFSAHVHAIEVYGYTIVHGVLTPEQCEQMRATLLACADQFGEGHTSRRRLSFDGTPCIFIRRFNRDKQGVSVK